MTAREHTRGALERLGGRTLRSLSAARALGAVFGSSLSGVVRGGRRPGEVAYQMYQVGNRSLLFIAVTQAFIGMVMIYQSCMQLSRVLGDLSRVGAEFAKLLVLDFAPTLTALMLATRIGAGIAAEVGSMKVTEQIDALRMCGVKAIDYLIVPRFMATLVMTLVLSVFGATIAFAAGMVTAWSSFDVNPRVFFNLDSVNYTHLTLGLSKAVAYGATTPIIAGFCGLRAHGGSEGVGRATTQAVIGSSFAIIVLDLIISAAGFLLVGDRL